MVRLGKAAVSAMVAVALLIGLAGCAQGSWWHANGSRVHFSVADGCPSRIKTQMDVSNPNQAASSLLRRSAMPSAGLVCFYGYYPDQTMPNAATANKLIDSVPLNAKSSALLARSILALSLTQPSGVVNCPADMIGVGALLAFTYGNGSTMDLNFHDTGCETVDNGTVAASQIASASFAHFQTTLTSVIGGALVGSGPPVSSRG